MLTTRLSALLVLFLVSVFSVSDAEATWHEHSPKFEGEIRYYTSLQNPRPAPDYEFSFGDGTPIDFGYFKGKIVLLNLWATWCPPCVKEMPSLDRLQAQLGGQDFEVVALSLDNTPDIVNRFYGDFELKYLNIYMDHQMKATEVFRAGGLPTSFVIDRNGNMLGGLAGPAEWDSEEAIRFIQYFIDTAPG